jgi:hypothetical protein
MRFDVLLHTLASQKRLRSLVEQTRHLPEHELLDSLVREFEQVCERYKSLSDFAAEASSHSIHVAPQRISVPALPLGYSGAHGGSEEQNTESLRRQLEDVERLIAEEVQRDWDARAGEIRERITRLKISQLVLRQQLEAIMHTEDVPVDQHNETPPVELSNDHRVYLYCVGADGSNTDAIIRCRNAGVDQSLLECTRRGLKVIFAIVSHDRFPMTTTGTLLLGKEESLKLRSLHEATVNALQVAESVVPFVCGTLVTGKHELLALIDSCADEWKKRLHHEGTSQQLMLRLYASDEVIGKTLGKQGKGRMNVKLLERILKRERALADTVHSALSAIAVSASIESVVGMSGGFSHDWKLILESSYTIASERRGELFAAVRRLEREHNHGQLLFELIGNGGRLTRARETHTISV